MSEHIVLTTHVSTLSVKLTRWKVFERVFDLLNFKLGKDNKFIINVLFKYKKRSIITFYNWWMTLCTMYNVLTYMCSDNNEK